MKHELGESYTLRTTRSSDADILCKIAVVIPARVHPLQNPEKCQWADQSIIDAYYWGAMNSELYDFETYAVAVDPKMYFRQMGVEVAHNMQNIGKPVLVRPKDLYETHNPPPPTTKELKAMVTDETQTPKAAGSRGRRKVS